MKKFIQYLISSIILLGSLVVNGQDINPETDTVRWDYGKVENKVRSETLSISGHFISYGSKSFLWVQNGMDHKYAFEIKGVKGSWSDITQTGELVYQAVCEGIDGTIRIYRQRRDVIIQLDFAKPDTLSPNIDLQVSSYSKI